jgi:hypothetical protein
MAKKKKYNFRCSCCGFECDGELQLIQHCNKEHPENHLLLFSMIGRFGSLEHATVAYQTLQMDFQTLSRKIGTLTEENARKHAEMVRLSKAVNAYNEAASSITHTLNLLTSSLDPLRQPE